MVILSEAVHSHAFLKISEHQVDSGLLLLLRLLGTGKYPSSDITSGLSLRLDEWFSSIAVKDSREVSLWPSLSPIVGRRGSVEVLDGVLVSARNLLRSQAQTASLSSSGRPYLARRSLTKGRMLDGVLLSARNLL